MPTPITDETVRPITLSGLVIAPSGIRSEIQLFTCVLEDERVSPGSICFVATKIEVSSPPYFCIASARDFSASARTLCTYAKKQKLARSALNTEIKILVFLVTVCPPSICDIPIVRSG